MLASAAVAPSFLGNVPLSLGLRRALAVTNHFLAWCLDGEVNHPAGPEGAMPRGEIGKRHGTVKRYGCVVSGWLIGHRAGEVSWENHRTPDLFGRYRARIACAHRLQPREDHERATQPLGYPPPPSPGQHIDRCADSVCP